MEVDGVPNVRTCIMPVKEGMRIKPQAKSVVTPEPFFGPANFTETPVIETDLAVVGGGPAGLSAALYAARYGIEPLVIEENFLLGGQLIKQTHKFFGSQSHYAGVRGIDIAKILIKEAAEKGIETWTSSSIIGYYPDNILGVEKQGKYVKVKAKTIIIATGASEKMAPFKGNDIPGVYGAGAIQTLMNVYGIAPGKEVLMVGAGNIGVIVAYQLLQAGVKVAAVVEGLPKVGAYLVHSAKIKRLGVPIYTGHTISRVLGDKHVEGAEIVEVDDRWQPIPGSKKKFELDTIGLAVGLSPSVEILSQAGAKQTYIPALGGYINLHNKNMETSIPGLFVAGDISGIEEASSAMMEGRIAGLSAAEKVIGSKPALMEERTRNRLELKELREGPFGERIRIGNQKLHEEAIKNGLQ
jgi:sarcosine oxidase subunit alpha